MRYIDPSLKAKLQLAHQTVYNDAEPYLEAIAARPKTPISTKDYWEETIVTAGVTSICTSVAIRKTGKTADKAYVAYVTNGNVLVVKSAMMTYPVTNMIWSVEKTISDCLSCALEFDGSFVNAPLKKIEYRSDAEPWLFYTTSTGELKAGILNGDYETLVGADVTAIDAIRGVASIYKDMDQGLIVFYVLFGTVYYNQRISGVWEGQTAVSLAPENAINIKAERVFDWRIVLHVEDDTGALTEIFTKMEASGWNGTEFISANILVESAEVDVIYSSFYLLDYISAVLEVNSEILYGVSPVMQYAANSVYTNVELELEDDYGYKIILTWDERIFGVDGHEAAFLLTDESDAVFGCTSIEKTGDKQITLIFQNFNNAIGDLTLTYTPGTMTGDVEAVSADSITFTPTGLVPFATEPPMPLSAANIQDWSED